MILKHWRPFFFKLKLNIVDVVGEKYSGVFKSLSPRSKNVGDWYFVKEGMLVLKAVVGIFFSSFPGDLQPSQTIVCEIFLC